MSKADYYEVLGVSRQVSETELKTAYRKLARQHHPDTCPGDPEAAGRELAMRLLGAGAAELLARAAKMVDSDD